MFYRCSTFDLTKGRVFHVLCCQYVLSRGPCGMFTMAPLVAIIATKLIAVDGKVGFGLLMWNRP